MYLRLKVDYNQTTQENNLFMVKKLN